MAHYPKDTGRFDPYHQEYAEAPKTVNTSGLVPLGHAVLVEPYEPEIKKGVIEIPDTVGERTAMVESRATVIAVGACCWPDEPPRAKPGDKVFITKFAGYMTKGPKDGKRYRLVNDNDIFCRIEE